MDKETAYWKIYQTGYCPVRSCRNCPLDDCGGFGKVKYETKQWYDYKKKIKRHFVIKEILN